MASFWERLFGKGPKQHAAPEPANDADDVLADLREQVERDVAIGFDTPERIVESAVATYEDVADPAFLDAQARLFLAEALAAHAQAQSAWPAETDCDRLDAAFAALERDGVVARQHFTCCGTCGLAEIDRELAAAGTKTGPVRGYTFYHWQDTEAAVDGYGLCLYYGACVEGEAPALAIGREIVAALEGHGLKPEWDGSWDRRIELPLDWKRRRAA